MIQLEESEPSAEKFPCFLLFTSDLFNVKEAMLPVGWRAGNTSGNVRCTNHREMWDALP